MGTEVQFKMFFPGYYFTKDVDEKAGNRSLQLSRGNSIMKNGNQLSGFLRWSTSNIHFRSEKEELRQLILKQESIFRHQLHELHRLYKIQKDLMNEVKPRGLRKSMAPMSPFQSHLFSFDDKGKQHVHHCASGFLKSGRIPTSGDRIVSETKVNSTPARRLFDLEVPADQYITEEHKLLPFAESGLPTEELSASTSAGIQGRSKERFQRMDYSASSLASFHERGLLNNLKTVQLGSSGSGLFGQSSLSTQVEFNKVIEPVSLSSDHHSSDLQTSRKIFGVEISQRNHSGSQFSLHHICNASNGSNRSFMKLVQGHQVVKDELLVRDPQERGDPYHMNTDSLLINFPRDSSLLIGITDSKKSRVGENSCSKNEKTLASHVDKYHPAEGVGSFNSNLIDNTTLPDSAPSGIEYGKEVEQSQEKIMNGRALSSREFLDLNVCPAEEEASSTLCSEISHIKPMRGELDLEIPVPETNESPREESTDSKQGSSVMLDNKMEEKDDGFLRVAAETLIAISSTHVDEIQEQIFPDESKYVRSKILQWFAETIISSLPFEPETDPLNHGPHIPTTMDDFEFATLNLVETKSEELSYKPPVLENLQENLPSEQPHKGRARRGRQKDFQRDVLPGLTSLSRNEVTEDLQMIEGLIKATDRGSRPGPLQRNGASKGSKARGRTNNKRSFADNDPINPGAVEKQKCGEPGIDEVALMGWGKRARRPKRPRCSAAIHSASLKEVF